MPHSTRPIDLQAGGGARGARVALALLLLALLPASVAAGADSAAPSGGGLAPGTIPATPMAPALSAPPTMGAPGAQPGLGLGGAPMPVPMADPGLAAATGETSGNYELRSGDVVRISVYQEPDLSTTTRVAGDGSVDVPLAGAVKVGGMTVRRAADAVRKALLGDYLINPQVTIMVMQATKQYYTILGQVARPGSYEMPSEEGLPLLQAVGQAGGFTRSAQPGNIIVRRMVKGKETTMKVNAKRLGQKDDGGAFVVLPGDVVTVAESLF